MKLHDWQNQHAIMQALRIKHEALKKGFDAESAESEAEKFLTEVEKSRAQKVPAPTYRAGA